jgi:hypothetical protein
MNNINQSIVPIHLWIISCKMTTPIDVNNNQLYHFHDNGKLEFILSHCKQLSKDGRQQWQRHNKIWPQHFYCDRIETCMS